MSHESGYNQKAIGKSDRKKFTSKSRICPKCGEKMVPTGRGVASSFPSPALARVVCSGSDCNHVKYVRLSSGRVEGSQSSTKGEQSA